MIRLNISYGKEECACESKDLKEGLELAYHAIGDAPYRLVGIDAPKLRAYVSSFNAKDMGAALELIKPAEITAYGKLPDLPPLEDGGEPRKVEYGALCESLMLETLIEKYYGPLVPKKPIQKTAVSKGRLFFVSDDKGWIVIKKMSILPETTPREAAAFMLSMKASILNKYMDLKFQNRSECVSKAAKAAQGKRKSLQGLKQAFADSGTDLCQFLETAAVLGYAPTPAPDMLKKAFPEIKLPGMKGRKPKG